MSASPVRNRTLWDAVVVAAAIFACAVGATAARGGPATRPTTRPTTAGAVDPDLVGWWRADRASAQEASDLSGKGHPAKAVAGAVVIETVDGRRGFRFARDSKGMTAGADASFDFTADFTVALRAKVAPDGGDVVLLSKVDPSISGGWAIVHGLRGLGGIGFVAAPQVLVPTPIKATDAWVHVAVTFRERDFLLYVNGKPIGTADLDVVPPPAKAGLLFGTSPSGRGGMDGWLDDLRIYHRALTEEEVATLAAGREPTNPYTKLAGGEERRVRALVAQLGSEAYAQREAATKSLRDMGRRIYPLLREYRDADDLEISSRVKLLLGEVPLGGGKER
jgi:hypothetical protein